MENNNLYKNFNKKDLEKEYKSYTVSYIEKSDIIKGMDILDVGGFGCGGLNTTLFFKNKGCNIDVMNIDNKVKELCDEFDITFINDNIFEYKNKDKIYDIIMLELPIETQLDTLKEDFITTLYDILKPNGYILTFFVDEIKEVPLKRQESTAPIIKEFKELYCTTTPLEETLKEKYGAEFLGRDHRICMKWFKFKKNDGLMFG